MNSKIRIDAKKLLSGSTARFFFISLISFLLRYGVPVLFSGTVYIFLKNGLLTSLVNAYGTHLTYFSFSVITGSLAFGILLFISSIRLGENLVYFTRANGGTGRFRTLFRFLNPRRSFKATSLYLQINARKLMWFIYFFLPSAICIGCVYYLYSLSYIAHSVYVVLTVGASIIMAFAFVMCRIVSLRLSASPYYVCLREALTSSGAINKSIRFTDGLLAEGVVLEYSMLGWVLSTLFILPAFYTIPYLKMVKAVYVTEVIFADASSTSDYAVNLLKLA